MLSLFIYELTDFYPNDIFIGVVNILNTSVTHSVALTAQTPAEISKALLRTCTDAEYPPRPLSYLLSKVCAIRDLFCLFLRAVDGWSRTSMPGCQPALLQPRQEMKPEEAVVLLFHPMSCCWTIAEAAWYQRDNAFCKCSL